MQVLAEGTKKAGVLNAARIADAIRKLDVKTPLGEVQFLDNGDLRAPQIYIFQVKGGEFAQVSP
jgi:ABC-type branched-subunit amino acid transport system substrate-binding protein